MLRSKRTAILVGLALMALWGHSPAEAQTQSTICVRTSPTSCTNVTSTNPFPVAGTFSGSITFPTVGAAVPATAIYNGLNVGGTLRGMTGLGLGSTFSQTVAIVDGSGNQVTTFGGSSASTGITGAAVPGSANYLGINVGGNLAGVLGGHGVAAGALRVELPTDGTGVIASVGSITNPVAVTGTFWQATQPVSGTVAFSNSTIAVTNTGTFVTQSTLAAETTKVIGTVNQGTSPWIVSGTITANAGTNLNTSALALDATVGTTNTDLGPPGATACATDTGSCSLNALAQRQAQRLTTINTTLGSPMQATGGTVGIVAGSAVIGHVIADSGSTTAVTGTVAISAASLPLPALAATSTKQSDGTQKSQIVDGSGNVIASTSNNLNVQCANCSGSGVSTADEASFTAGTSLFAGSGGFYQTTATSNALTTGQQGVFQVTANRALFSNLRNAAGTEVGTSGAPLRIDPTGGTTQPVSGTVAFSNTTIAVTNAGTFATQATLAAETTKVIGTVNQGTSPWVISGTVTANAGTNLNTSALALDATVGTTNTDIGPPGATACATDTGSCSINALTQRLAQRLTTINTTLGSPIQATGGTVGIVAGSAVIGHVIADSGSTTAVTGTVTVSGTVTANAGTNLNTSALALESGGNLATIKTNTDSLVLAQGSTTSGQTGNLVLGATTTAAPAYTTAKSNPLSLTTTGLLRVDGSGVTQPVSGTVAFSNTTIATTNAGTFAVQATLAAETTKVIGTVNQGTSPWVISGALTANQSVNVAQINGVTTLMGNGVTGTGSQRVTIASDNTAFSVNATLSAETTKVIGTVNQGTSPWVISGALTANQSVNVAQINGVTTLMGNGVTGTGSQRVTIASDNTAFAVNATLSAETTKVIGTVNQGTSPWTIGGAAASGASVSGNPVLVGGQAINAEPTAVTNGQAVRSSHDLTGKQIVLPYANPENFVSGVTAAMTGTTTTSLLAAPAAGLRNYITQCTFSNSHATVGTMINIQDGSGGTTLYSAPAAPAYGGASITFPTPLRQPTTATAIFVANVTTGSNTFASCSGYKGI